MFNWITRKCTTKNGFLVPIQKYLPLTAATLFIYKNGNSIVEDDLTGNVYEAKYNGDGEYIVMNDGYKRFIVAE